MISGKKYLRMLRNFEKSTRTKIDVEYDTPQQNSLCSWGHLNDIKVGSNTTLSFTEWKLTEEHRDRKK